MAQLALGCISMGGRMPIPPPDDNFLRRRSYFNYGRSCIPQDIDYSNLTKCDVFFFFDFLPDWALDNYFEQKNSKQENDTLSKSATIDAKFKLEPFYKDTIYAKPSNNLTGYSPNMMYKKYRN